MKLAVIGPGRLGRVLGHRLVSSGHEVVYAQGEAARRAAATQPGTHAMSNSDAAAAADVVILTAPYTGLRRVLADCGQLDGKLIWTCVNAFMADGNHPVGRLNGSAAEAVASLAPGARVVAALPPLPDVLASGHNVFGGVRPTSWVCGGHNVDKAVVSGLLRSIGADPYDAGPLEAARLVEPTMKLVAIQAQRVKPPRTLGLRLLEGGWERLDRNANPLA
jgi:8-hydroxy-5-deazaflavin:NADPH oxidoreductase